MVAATQKSEKSTPNPTTLIVFLAILALLIALTFWMIGPYLLALVTGGILALLASPVYHWLRCKNFPEKWAAFMVTTGIILVFIVPASICLSLALKQGLAIGQSFSGSDFYSIQTLVDRISAQPLVEAFGLSAAELDEKAGEILQGAIRMGSTAVINVAGYLPNIVMQLALASIACFFLLMDGRTFIHWLNDKIPLDNDVRQQIVESFKNTAIATIWATLAASAAQSIAIFSGYVVLGIPSAFLAGGATFLFAWVPVIGTTPVWLVGAIYLYAEGSTGKAIAMIIIGLSASLIDNVVRPLVLKGRSDMHPLISLIAIIGGLGVFGILGVFLGPIIIAVLLSLLHIWPDVARRFRLIPATEKDRSPPHGEGANS